MLNLEKIKSAKGVLDAVVRKTEILDARGITDSCSLYLKTENLQHTGSFKLRGAFYKISSLSPQDRAKGVVACSAGNHAQGVAFAAKHFGIPAKIFLPAGAPISKIEATRLRGAEVVLVDGIYDDAYAASIKYAEENDIPFIHPFNDEDVIAGQGTVGLEIIEEMPDVDVVIIPMGGGGLAAGMACAIKALKPECKVYGVQAKGADSMVTSLRSGEIVSSKTVRTFADGIAVKDPGNLTHEMLSKLLDESTTVYEDEIALAILKLMEKQRLVAEGAGAVSVAAVMADKFDLKGKKVCAVVSGGNIDVNILSRVISRGMISEGRLTNLTVSLTDKPGQLEAVSKIIARGGANVIGVQYAPGGETSCNETLDINGCFLKISMETRNFEHLTEIRKALSENGFELIN